jgi:hypothetical protein
MSVGSVWDKVSTYESLTAVLKASISSEPWTIIDVVNLKPTAAPASSASVW